MSQSHWPLAFYIFVGGIILSVLLTPVFGLGPLIGPAIAFIIAGIMVDSRDARSITNKYVLIMLCLGIPVSCVSGIGIVGIPLILLNVLIILLMGPFLMRLAGGGGST